MKELISFRDSVVFVTGAGQGVGRAVAMTAASLGARGIVVNDFLIERAQSVVDELEAQGSHGLAVSSDVSDFAQVKSNIEEATERFGAIDVLVNNAGNAGPKPTPTMNQPFWKQTREDWDGYLGTNLYGVLNTCNLVVPGMIENGYGRIVNVVSDAARFGEANREAYSAAKAGVAGFTRSLSASLGRYLIAANCVSLAATRTPRTEGNFADDERFGKMMKRYILRRAGEPEDAANMICFLASDAASWVTGQTVPVNGGYSFAL